MNENVCLMPIGGMRCEQEENFNKQEMRKKEEAL